MCVHNTDLPGSCRTPYKARLANLDVGRPRYHDDVDGFWCRTSGVKLEVRVPSIRRCYFVTDVMSPPEDWIKGLSNRFWRIGHKFRLPALPQNAMHSFSGLFVVVALAVSVRAQTTLSPVWGQCEYN